MPGTTNSMDQRAMKRYMSRFSPMSFPTKEKPSNSVRNSARSPRRTAMQYSTKPALSTIPSREVRMERKVASRPESPARVSAMLRTRLRPRYRAAMARGETWASASRSFISHFSCLRSISVAIIKEVLPKYVSIHGNQSRHESSLACFCKRSNPIAREGHPGRNRPKGAHFGRGNRFPGRNTMEKL